MTIPFERTRALRWAGELLRELATSDLADPALKRQIQVVLRHYPQPVELQAWSLHSRSTGCDCLAQEPGPAP
jgi:hypothetical protein